jgi:hypothetical protein
MRRLLALAIGLLAASASARSGDLRDPMRPPGSAPSAARASAPSAMRLEGVISGAARVAIVNGRVVVAGDLVNGATILEVLADGVRFTRGGRIQTLTLPGTRAVATVRVASEARKP